MTAQVASKRNLALGEARTQKGHYLRIIFIKQEFTRQRREGKIDLTLSPFFFFFYLLTHRVGKVGGLFVLQESTMHKRLHHNNNWHL